jgi:hypothetical protein
MYYILSTIRRSFFSSDFARLLMLFSYPTAVLLLCLRVSVSSIFSHYLNFLLFFWSSFFTYILPYKFINRSLDTNNTENLYLLLSCCKLLCFPFCLTATCHPSLNTFKNIKNDMLSLWHGTWHLLITLAFNFQWSQNKNFNIGLYSFFYANWTCNILTSKLNGTVNPLLRMPRVVPPKFNPSR